jgi:hypothetical protein
MLLQGEDKKICTLAAQKNGMVPGATCYIIGSCSKFIVWESELQGRPWKFRVSYNDGIKIEDNEGVEYTFEENKPKISKKNTQVGKNDADATVV